MSEEQRRSSEAEENSKRTTVPRKPMKAIARNLAGGTDATARVDPSLKQWQGGHRGE
jgi:hypothetical protein